MYYLHERNNYGASEPELVTAYDADMVFVRTLFYLETLAYLAPRYFSLFITYTPYTIYKCEFSVSSLRKI